ncbi:MAG: YggS family pyridoxal phosphate-dependent enzyme [Desulfovibrionaceae bacterium]|nr:YggS family pyridoxal phosphate-dependent enzyme [Desulfovibrionaceae bacterium]
MTRLEERWRLVMDGVEQAARAAGRPADAVRLVAVSKFHPVQAVAELAALGQRDFGENYVQEARSKQQALAGLPLRWHAIGGIQTNKARDVAGRFHLIHSLDSRRLADALARRLAAGSGQRVLIQVNIGSEAQKSGVEARDLPALVEHVLAMPSLRLCGLMCLPPRCGEGEAARPYFARLRELRDDMQRRFGVELPQLSMGMSGDYRQAVAEGATLVRVGTDIFGPRPMSLKPRPLSDEEP